MMIDGYDLVPQSGYGASDKMEKTPAGLEGDWVKYDDHEAAIKAVVIETVEAERESIAAWLDNVSWATVWSLCESGNDNRTLQEIFAKAIRDGEHRR